MQLMTAVSPTLEALKKDGDAGRRKITQLIVKKKKALKAPFSLLELF